MYCVHFQLFNRIKIYYLINESQMEDCGSEWDISFTCARIDRQK